MFALALMLLSVVRPDTKVLKRTFYLKRVSDGCSYKHLAEFVFVIFLVLKRTPHPTPVKVHWT